MENDNQTIDNEISERILEPIKFKKERKAKVETIKEEIQLSDNKFQIGDDIEVHGLPECKEYFSYGKVSKVLDNYMYAIDGMCEPVKKGIIGHRCRLVRTFHEINLRKIEIK